MKYGLIWTIMTKDNTTEEQLINNTYKLINILEEKVYKDKNYAILEKQSIGLHKNAKRSHIHLSQFIEWTSKKEIKHLDKKLFSLIILEKKELKDLTDIQLSIWNENDPKFNPDYLYGYPLKEYTKDNEILFLDQFINIPTTDIYRMRKLSNDIYQPRYYEWLKKKENEYIDEETTQNKYEYINKNLDFFRPDQIHQKLDFKSLPYKDKLRRVIKILLEYQKLQYSLKQKRVFKATALKELAESYLYFNNLSTEDDILERLGL